MKREKFSSRLGFILVSAGCAIGIGNVWKFPYMCGEYGGAAFILIYLLFLLIMGIPAMVCEFSIGRGSKKSVAMAFEQLEPAGTSWHLMKYIGIFGCYLLMMFYTMVGGWMIYYCFRSLRGDFSQADPEYVTNAFGSMLADYPTMIFWTILICVIGFIVCKFGLQSGIEKVTKVMMIALLAIMVVLAIHSVFLEGAVDGIRFYLVPDFQKMVETGIGNVVFGAMSQAFFTLSLGIGAMMIFGSYLDHSRSMTGEAINITILDTFVALTAGFIVIPACFSYGIEPGAGPSLVFITLPNIFAQMTGGFLWSALFFLFLTFAALSTIIAVFENIISFYMDMGGWSRKKAVVFNIVLIIALSLPAVLGFNLLSGFQPMGAGTSVMDLEDFLVSYNLLPLGSMIFVLFCVKKNGWGWDNFRKEANEGKGMKISNKLQFYMTYILPAIIVVVYLKGYYDTFAKMGPKVLAGWMAFAAALLITIFTLSSLKKKEK